MTPEIFAFDEKLADKQNFKKIKLLLKQGVLNIKNFIHIAYKIKTPIKIINASV